MIDVKEEMRKVAHEAWVKEATYLEARLRELVGTGMDLAVFRRGPVFANNGETVTMTTLLTCLPVFPGDRPHVPSGDTCTIYEVSKYKGAVPA